MNHKCLLGKTCGKVADAISIRLEYGYTLEKIYNFFQRIPPAYNNPDYSITARNRICVGYIASIFQCFNGPDMGCPSYSSSGKYKTCTHSYCFND